jgi:hypothetical protein
MSLIYHLIVSTLLQKKQLQKEKQYRAIGLQKFPFKVVTRLLKEADALLLPARKFIRKMPEYGLGHNRVANQCLRWPPTGTLAACSGNEGKHERFAHKQEVWEESPH